MCSEKTIEGCVKQTKEDGEAVQSLRMIKNGFVKLSEQNPDMGRELLLDLIMGFYESVMAFFLNFVQEKVEGRFFLIGVLLFWLLWLMNRNETIREELLKKNAHVFNGSDVAKQQQFIKSDGSCNSGRNEGKRDERRMEEKENLRFEEKLRLTKECVDKPTKVTLNPKHRSAVARAEEEVKKREKKESSVITCDGSEVDAVEATTASLRSPSSTSTSTSHPQRSSISELLYSRWLEGLKKSLGSSHS